MTQPRILVVDDEEAILFALQRYLATQRYAVDCAADIDAARKLLTKQFYQVVIADLRLGANGNEGLQVLAWARATNSDTKMILLTAYGSAEVEAEARRLGVSTVLKKPIPLPDIAQVLFGMAPAN